MPSPVEKAVTEFIGDQLRAMRGESANGKPKSFERIAQELGITKPQVHSLVKGTGGAGPKVEQIFADRLFKGSVDKLRAEAQKWWTARAATARKERPTSNARPANETSHTFRYPSLGQALAAHANRWSPPAVSAACSMALDADEDPGEAWWIETLDRLDAAIKVSIPKLPERVVDPLAGLDDRRVRGTRNKR